MEAHCGGNMAGCPSTPRVNTGTMTTDQLGLRTPSPQHSSACGSSTEQIGQRPTGEELLCFSLNPRSGKLTLWAGDVISPLAITASHLCCGSDSSPQISPSPRADNRPSECYLLQRESTLIAHTCNPRLHQPIYAPSLQAPLPVLSTSSSLPPSG